MRLHTRSLNSNSFPCHCPLLDWCDPAAAIHPLARGPALDRIDSADTPTFPQSSRRQQLRPAEATARPAAARGHAANPGPQLSTTAPSSSQAAAVARVLCRSRGAVAASHLHDRCFHRCTVRCTPLWSRSYDTCSWVVWRLVSSTRGAWHVMVPQLMKLHGKSNWTFIQSQLLRRGILHVFSTAKLLGHLKLMHTRGP